jgi:curved DNA-binding protein
VARDYYDVLGVARDADAEEIQQAFRRLARRYHPDVSKDPASEERFKEINEAYQVLSDPDSRRRYDRFGPDFRQIPEGYEEAATAGGFHRGSPFGGRTGGSVYVGEDFGGIDFEDLFGGLFGARGAGAPIRGADQEAEIELSVEEAYHGGRRRITLPGTRRSYEVTIPPGVIDGQRIRLAGQGGQGRRGAAGDLYLVVRIAAHPRYRLQGRDIYVDLPLTPWEAALGATLPVTTPGGEAEVQVPPGTSSGRRLRLRGEGMPSPRGRPGDLYAEVQVAVPERLSRQERKLFEELAKESTFDPRKQQR